MRPIAFCPVRVARPGFFLLALFALCVVGLSAPARADVINTFNASATFQSGTTLSGTISVDTTPADGAPYFSAANLTTTGFNSYEFNNVVYSGNDGLGGTLLSVYTQNNNARVSLDIPYSSSALGSYTGGSISTGQLSNLFVNSPYPYGTTDSLVGGLIGAPLATSACSADLRSSVTLATLSNTFLNQPTSMNATFKPNGVTLAQAATACGVDSFDWRQTIDVSPTPSAVKYSNGSTITAPPSISDPPKIGYNYKSCGSNLSENFPFYYTPNNVNPTCNLNSVFGHEPDNSTLKFYDRPSDSCLPGFVVPYSPAYYLRMSACQQGYAPLGSEREFTTSLVGVSDESDGTYTVVDLTSMLQGFPCIVNSTSNVSGCTWKWESDFNGTTGGIATFETSGLGSEDDDGSGGVKTLSIGSVDVPEPSSVYLISIPIIMDYTCSRRKKSQVKC